MTCREQGQLECSNSVQQRFEVCAGLATGHFILLYKYPLKNFVPIMNGSKIAFSSKLQYVTFQSMH